MSSPRTGRSPTRRCPPALDGRVGLTPDLVEGGQSFFSVGFVGGGVDRTHCYVSGNHNCGQILRSPGSWGASTLHDLPGSPYWCGGWKHIRLRDLRVVDECVVFRNEHDKISYLVAMFEGGGRPFDQGRAIQLPMHRITLAMV